MHHNDNTHLQPTTLFFVILEYYNNHNIHNSEITHVFNPLSLSSMCFAEQLLRKHNFLYCMSCFEGLQHLFPSISFFFFFTFSFGSLFLFSPRVLRIKRQLSNELKHVLNSIDRIFSFFSSLNTFLCRGFAYVTSLHGKIFVEPILSTVNGTHLR